MAPLTSSPLRVLSFEVIDSANNPLLPEVRQMLLEYRAEVEQDTCFGDYESELNSLPGGYLDPEGCLIALAFKGQPVAIGAFRRAEDEVCELKRIYVLPDMRGMGFGRMITEELLRRALDSGYRAAKLDSLTTMHSAQEMYKSLGFKETHRVTPEKGAGVVYFERSI